MVNSEENSIAERYTGMEKFTIAENVQAILVHLAEDSYLIADDLLRKSSPKHSRYHTFDPTKTIGDDAPHIDGLPRVLKDLTHVKGLRKAFSIVWEDEGKLPKDWFRSMDCDIDTAQQDHKTRKKDGIKPDPFFDGKIYDPENLIPLYKYVRLTHSINTAVQEVLKHVTWQLSIRRTKNGREDICLYDCIHEYNGVLPNDIVHENRKREEHRNTIPAGLEEVGLPRLAKYAMAMYSFCDMVKGVSTTTKETRDFTLLDALAARPLILSEVDATCRKLAAKFSSTPEHPRLGPGGDGDRKGRQ